MKLHKLIVSLAVVTVVLAITCTNTLAVTVDEGKQKASEIRSELAILETEYNRQLEQYEAATGLAEYNKKFGITVSDNFKESFRRMMKIVYLITKIVSNI